MSRSLAASSASALLPPLPPAASGFIRHGTREHQRAGVALFLLGFASFSLIYCVQPLLPAFAASFHVSPAESSLALSLTTGCLAVSILLAGAFSQALGRRGLMFASMAGASVLNLAAALSPGWHGLLAARALEGFVLGGVPAVAMAWLAEEIEPAHLGRTMGLYVGGTAFGAMVGRVGLGVATEFVSWRLGMGLLGALCLVAALGFLVLLPPSRHFEARRGFDARFHLRTWGRHLRNPALLSLYAVGFLLTSIFVTLFNYSTFRLTGAPYGLGQTQVSLIFLAYGFGIVSSSLAGRLSDRFGRRPLLLVGFLLMLAGILLTLLSSLIAIGLGIALVTTGFFIGHSVASGSVGALAHGAKGHATSLYLLIYYLGASVTGALGGWVWQEGGWPAIGAMTSGFALAGLLLSQTLPAQPKPQG
ncbi:MFS transporter [Aureimonas sp. AU40]|uniref:MFS transporter n=1 Tax=Aureimonas sp. AU40 TaxID=1637747 RepID=UPI000781CD64|nr:MFS transporter [Aureimonas sp. AU40]